MRRIWSETLRHYFEVCWVSIWVNLEPLEPVDAFPYLSRTIEYKNYDWADVYHSLQKSQRRWEVISKVMVNTGEMVRACGMLYKTVAQTVLLYGRNSCVLKGSMLRLLEGYHYQTAWWIAGIMHQRTKYEEW